MSHNITVEGGSTVTLKTAGKYCDRDIVVTATGGGGGGSLPGGITALASGTVTPSADATSTLQVTHNLGVVPNFLVWWDTADYSSAAGTSLAYLGAVVEKNVKASTSNTIVNNHHFSIHGYSTNSTSGQTGSRAVNTSRMTATTASLVCSTSYPIKAGHTYKWVCGVME